MYIAIPQLQSIYDLTGTRIVTSRPASVIAGSKWSSVGTMYLGDHLIEQVSVPTYLVVVVVLPRYRVLSTAISGSIAVYTIMLTCV